VIDIHWRGFIFHKSKVEESMNMLVGVGVGVDKEQEQDTNA